VLAADIRRVLVVDDQRTFTEAMSLLLGMLG
jgi:hypothetical protein